MDYTEVLNWAIENSHFSDSAIHGVNHWLTVKSNGLMLARHYKNIDETVVSLFGLLHDIGRRDEGRDPGHGLRAAKKIIDIQHTLLSSLTSYQFDLLYTAIAGHDTNQKTKNITVGACWDADRLDLPRVGVKPISHYLYTQHAKSFTRF